MIKISWYTARIQGLHPDMDNIGGMLYSLNIWFIMYHVVGSIFTQKVVAFGYYSGLLLQLVDFWGLLCFYYYYDLHLRKKSARVMHYLRAGLLKTRLRKLWSVIQFVGFGTCGPGGLLVGNRCFGCLLVLC